MPRDIDTINDIRFVRSPAGIVIGAHEGDTHYEVTISDHDQQSLMVRAARGDGHIEHGLSAVEIYEALRGAIEKNPVYKAAAKAAAEDLAAKAAGAHDR